MSDFKNGDRVKFKPGPKSKGEVEATVTEVEGSAFLVTKDDAGKERRVRPGACKPA
jgi:hypothetical protein